MRFKVLLPQRVALVLVSSFIGFQAYAQDSDERLFSSCKKCHQVGSHAANSTGPHLNGLLGRKAGTVEGFEYTEGMKSSKVVWSEKTFFDFIKDPRAYVPKTNMVFVGMNNEVKAKSLFAYLSQFGKDGEKISKP